MPLEPEAPTVFRTYPAEAAGAHVRASSSGSSEPPLTSPPPPPALRADVCCRDCGSATPRHLRMTHWTLPARAQTAREMGLPLGCVVTPLAEPAAGEAPVPLVDAGAQGPLRCTRCHAYVSPFAHFAPGGAECTCALCGAHGPVPAWFGALLAAEPQHPVLTHGSVEYALDNCPLYASGDGDAASSASTGANPPALCFVLDASRAAVAAGRTAAVVQGIREIVAAGVLQETRVAFVSYASRAVHFWQLPDADSAGESAAPRRPRALVFSDVTGASFTPLAGALFVSPVAARDSVLAFLDRFCEFAAGMLNDEEQEIKASPAAARQGEGPCFGAAIQDAALAFEAAGLCGRIEAFCGDVPTGGVGALVARDDPTRHTSRAASADEKKEEREEEATVRRLLQPAGTFYTQLGRHCAAQGVGVDVFALYDAEADLASVGELARCTGGVLRAWAGFCAARDSRALCVALWQRLARPWGCRAAFRVRASRGLAVRTYCGGAGVPAGGGTSVALAAVDSATTLTVRLAHEGDLPPGHDAVIQAALLYTTSEGSRRVRVHTVAVPVARCANSPALVYRALDGDALAVCVARLAAHAIAVDGEAPRAVAEAHTRRLGAMLAAYRAACAPDRARGQLVLPEAAQLLPLHALALQRLPLLRARACRADQRTALLRALDAAPVPVALLQLYPRLYSLGELHERVRVQCLRQGNNEGDYQDDCIRNVVAEATRLSRACQNVNDVYLADDGVELHVWLAGKPPGALLEALFGAPLPAGAAQSLTAVGAVRPEDTPALEECLAARLASASAGELQDSAFVRVVAALVSRLAECPQRAPVCVRVATASMRPADAALAWHLAVEDAADGPSYPDYIRTLHSLVRQHFV